MINRYRGAKKATNGFSKKEALRKIAEIENREQERLVISENAKIDENIISINEESGAESKPTVEESEAIPLANKSEILLTELDIEKIKTEAENLPAELGIEMPEPLIILETTDKQDIENKLALIPEEIVIEPELGKVAALEQKELCFDISEQALEPIQEQIKAYQFAVINQSEQAINYYFLLTKRSQSLALMKSNAQSIKQKGLDTWMIEKGEFSQRISLGVFSNPQNVKNAKIAYMKKIGQALEIIPQYKNKEKKYLKITLPEHKMEAAVMADLSDYKLKSQQCDSITNNKN